MPVFTQTRFPRLWRLFQAAIGGAADKRRLCLELFDGQGHVLEVGCSVGTIAQAFRDYPQVEYTGVDIDCSVIELARRAFRDLPKFRFLCGDLATMPDDGARYDYALFAGVLHHVTDDVAVGLLASGVKRLSATGKIVVVDPLLPAPTDSRLVHEYLRLEQGNHVRSGEEMRRLLQLVSDMRIEQSRETLVGATPWSSPRCARFGLYELRRSAPQ